MSSITPSAEQLMSIIQTQTAIAKLGLDLNAVMTLVADKAQAMTAAKGAVVELAEGDDMVYRAVSNNAAHLLGLRLHIANSLSGLCIAQQQTLYCADADLDPRVDRIACRRVGLRSMAVVPLIHNAEAVGVLKIYSEHVDAFQPADLQILTMMSELIAAAMYHATKHSQQALYKLATKDSLTGLANRALFLDVLRQSMQQAKQDDKVLGVLMIDMDGLKPINDQYGHRMGDEALKELAKRILSQTRKEDLVARLGGDEFVVILTALPSCDQAKHVMVRIIDTCSEPFMFESLQLKMGASIGVAFYPIDALDIEKLLECADLHMYMNKRERKNVTV